MLSDYIQAAMQRAKYEILPDDGTYYGHIPDCPGVWANSPTLEECREELQSVLEDWILVKLRHADNDFVAIDGIDLNVQPVMDQEP